MLTTVNMCSTSCSAGGVPLRVVIISGENETTITEALTLIYESSFYHQMHFMEEKIRAQKYVLLTAERAALKTVLPNTTYLLCIFHFLQCWWSWLLESKQGISKDDRQPIFNLVRKLL